MTSESELREILDSLDHQHEFLDDFNFMISDDQELIVPLYWKR